MFSRRKVLAGLSAAVAAAKIGPLPATIADTAPVSVGTIKVMGDSFFFEIGEETWRYNTKLDVWHQIVRSHG